MVLSHLRLHSKKFGRFAHAQRTCPSAGDRLNDEEGHLTAIDMLSASSSTLGPTKTIFGSVTAE